jgi:hypothetical protein
VGAATALGEDGPRSLTGAVKGAGAWGATAEGARTVCDGRLPATLLLEPPASSIGGAPLRRIGAEATVDST